MGVALSTHVTSAPVFLASAIIGFISFAFTVSTFLRVFWESLATLFAAETEIHAYLTNLRVELDEEKASLRQLRRHNRDFGHSKHGRQKGRTSCRLDDVTIRSLQDVLRHLSKRFKTLEQPFLWENNASGARRSRSTIYPQARESGAWEDDQKVDRRSSRVAPHGRHRATDDDDDDDDREWARGHDYADITLAKRFVWLRRRAEAVSLTESLSRLQTRRIARQIGEVTVALYEYGSMIEDMRHDVDSVSARLNRVVGIRRVD